MALLTAEQLARLRDIIRDASTSLAVSTTGMEVSDEDLQRLVNEGYVDPEDLHNIVLDSFEYGRLMQQFPGARHMGYQQFINYLAHNPVELSDQERRAFEFLQSSAGQFCVGLGTRAEGDLALTIADMNQQLAAAFRYSIQDEAGMSAARRESIGQLTTRLRQMSDDWARDWGRTASTESQIAHQMGYIESVAEQYGQGEMYAKIPEPTACPDCLRLYLEDGKPMVRPVEWWQRQGVANYGLKRADWKSVMGAAHPWCLLPGSMIITSHGECRIEDISLGDKVLQEDGTFGVVTNLFRRFYDGQAVELVLSNGLTSRVTHGHLIKEACGHWKPAELIHQGSKLLGGRSGNTKESPSSIRKKFLFARIFLGFDGAGMPVAAVHFDGDFAVPVTKIHKKSSDDLIIRESINTALIKKIFDHDLKIGTGFPLSEDESLGDLFIRIDLPSPCFMSRSGIPLTLLGTHALCSDLLAFRSRSLTNPSLMESLDNCGSRHFKLAGYRQYGEILATVHIDDVGNAQIHTTTTPGNAEFRQPLVNCGRTDPQNISDLVGRQAVPHVELQQDAFRNSDLPHVSVISSRSFNYRGACHNLTVEKTNTYISSGVINKNCQCQGARVPAGWGFDENWDLVPLEETEKSLRKAGPFIGPRGGKWADPAHKIPWKEKIPRRPAKYKSPDHKKIIRLYHGTRSDDPPEIFDPDKSHDKAVLAWFSDDPAYSADYGEVHEYNVYLGKILDVSDVMGSTAMGSMEPEYSLEEWQKIFRQKGISFKLTDPEEDEDPDVEGKLGDLLYGYDVDLTEYTNLAEALIRSDFDTIKTIERGSDWRKYTVYGLIRGGASKAKLIRKEFIEDETIDKANRNTFRGKRPSGSGWQPIPHTSYGGYRRRRGAKWEYWYPGKLEEHEKEWEKLTLKRMARLERAQRMVKLGGEYDIGHRYIAVFPDASEPGKVRIQEFDARGFSGHQTFNTMKELIEAVATSQDLEPAPGILDELAAKPEWTEGMAHARIIQKFNSLPWSDMKGDVWGALNNLVDAKGPEAAANTLDKVWGQIVAGTMPSELATYVQKSRADGPLDDYVAVFLGIHRARAALLKGDGKFGGFAGNVGIDRPIGTMGNVGKPARTPGANTWTARAIVDHPKGPVARRKKAKKKKRKKQDRSEEKAAIAISPVRYTDGYVRDKPHVDALPKPDPERGRKWLDDQQEKRARGRDTAGRLTIRPQDTR